MKIKIELDIQSWFYIYSSCKYLIWSHSDTLKFALVWSALSSNIQILLINLLTDKLHGAQSFENMSVIQLDKKFLPFMQTEGLFSYCQQLTSWPYSSTAEFN